MTQSWWTGAARSLVTTMAARGMVVAEHALASEAGLDALRRGGHAVDAAVAVSATLSVVAPYMIGPAGVGYMLVYDAAQRKTDALDFIGRTPGAAPAALYSLTRGDLYRGARGAVVPGSAAGWVEAHRKYGRLPLHSLFTDAIHHARHGFPIAPRVTEYFERCSPALSRCENASAVYLSGGSAPRSGQLFKQQRLADTLAAIAENGDEPFYRGDIARRIIAHVRANGGFIDERDMTGYRPRWHEPKAAPYRGLQIHSIAPPGSGIQILETLRILEQFDLRAAGPADFWHLLIEAIKIAVEDRIRATWSDASEIELLLSEDYARDAAAKIRRNRAASSAGDRFHTRHRAHGHTTYFCVVDAEGNAVSSTQTLGNLFGCGEIAGDTGVLLNNWMYWWDLDEQSPNRLQDRPGPPSCVVPALATDSSGLRFAVGSPGSFGILQIVPQVIVNLVDFEMRPQAAVEAPRVISLGASGELYLEANPGFGNLFWLAVEDRIAPEVRGELEQRGHLLWTQGPYMNLMGCAGAITRDPANGALEGGADPRRDSHISCW
ncbi:MAG TPA: gamma-glutamyltransferase family protein [Bryobacteraceae bacterium]|nr:gamma-glutamyltransferase family protein [Bryobacteraceae bacterium]